MAKKGSASKGKVGIPSKGKVGGTVSRGIPNPSPGPGPYGMQPTGTTYVPPTPGVPTKPVDPFFTAADLAELARAKGEWDTQLSDIQTGLENLGAQSTYDKTNIEKARVHDLNQSADEMAARGLGMSSIKDADMFDIESTARLRKEFIDTQLKTAGMQADRNRKIINDTRDSFNKAMNQKAIENAQGINANMPEWQVPPTSGGFQYTSPQTAPRPPKVSAPQQQAAFAQSQGRNAEHASEAVARAQKLAGKKGGRGGGGGPKNTVGTVGGGSAGIR